MRLDPNPLFRRAIAPWYDSTVLCLLVLVAMVLVIWFCAVGVGVAAGNPEYRRFLWVPWMVLSMAAVVAVSIIFRMGQRLYLDLSHGKPAEPD